MTHEHDMLPWQQLSIKDKFFSFHGRLNRKLFITLTVMTWVLAFGISRLSALSRSAADPATSYLYIALAVALAVPTMLMTLSIAIRRWHDLGKSWLCIFHDIGCSFMLPLSALLYMYLFCTKGTTGENQYGPDPLQHTPSAATLPKEN